MDCLSPYSVNTHASSGINFGVKKTVSSGAIGVCNVISILVPLNRASRPIGGFAAMSVGGSSPSDKVVY
ncbi:MAG TPA: hypothetical protein DDW24_05225 [Blastocatellia bacterium]|nr:hypothetical protein [Blastocatellia bacterium]